MDDFLRRFWKWLVSLAGVAGLYLGALAVNLTNIFFVILAVAVVLGAARPAGTKTLEVIKRFRAHPQLLSEVARLENEADKAQRSIRRADGRAKASYDKGVLEGRAQARGAILAVYSGEDIPEIRSIASRPGGAALVGIYTDKAPQKGARFNVSTEHLGDLKGVVEVTSVRTAEKAVLLECVSRTVPRFWAHLTERASYDSAPPPGVELTAYVLPTVSPSTEGEDADNG